MSDYEILIVVFTVLAIVVGVLVEYIKNDRPLQPKCTVIYLIEN